MRQEFQYTDMLTGKYRRIPGTFAQKWVTPETLVMEELSEIGMVLYAKKTDYGHMVVFHLMASSPDDKPTRKELEDLYNNCWTVNVDGVWRSKAYDESYLKPY